LCAVFIQDYVRTGATVPSNPDLVVSGSYDHTVKVWDKREQKEIISVDHGSPVESVLMSPNGALMFSAGEHIVFKRSS
jgi:U3 small nucleolar RNA-associated protein 15